MDLGLSNLVDVAGGFLDEKMILYSLFGLLHALLLGNIHILADCGVIIFRQTHFGSLCDLSLCQPVGTGHP